MKNINLNDYIFDVRKYYANRNNKFLSFFNSIKMKKEIKNIISQMDHTDITYKNLADFINFVKALKFYKIDLVGRGSTRYKIDFEFFSNEVKKDVEIAKLKFSTYSVDSTGESATVDYEISISTNSNQINVYAVSNRKEKHSISYEYSYNNSVKNTNSAPCIKNVSEYLFLVIQEYFDEFHLQLF